MVINLALEINHLYDYLVNKLLLNNNLQQNCSERCPDRKAGKARKGFGRILVAVSEIAVV